MGLELVQTELPIGLNVEAFEEWREYREENGKPLSCLARKKVINRLLRHDEKHQQLMVDRAIENDWQGLHDIERPRECTSRQQSIAQDLTSRDWAR